MISTTVHIGKEGYAFLAYMRALKTRLPRAIKFVVKEEAILLKKTMTDGIRKRAPGGKAFVPLKKSTIQGKGHNRPLVDTRALLRSFTVWDTTSGDGVSAAVGIPSDVKHPGSKKSMAELMHIHEYGRKGPWQLNRKSSFRSFTTMHPGLPARPVFGPVWDAWSPGFNKRFTERFYELISNDAFVSKRKITKEFRKAQRDSKSLASIVTYPKMARAQYSRKKKRGS